jgi:hypothetical protein
MDKRTKRRTTIEEIEDRRRRVLKVLAHDVAPAEEGNASSRGDLSAAWKIIEDECGCNKSGGEAILQAEPNARSCATTTCARSTR